MWPGIVLLFGLSGALCATSDPVSIDTIIADFFRQGDKDNDGIYSLAEAWTEILAMDRDGDKKVNLAEYTAQLHSIAPTMVPDAPNFFAKQDIDQDGIIDQQDVNKIYALVDTDGNGQVTMSEYSIFVKKVFGDLGFGTTGPTLTGTAVTLIPDPKIVAYFNTADKNRNGLVSFDEQWAENLLMDTNGDNKISFQEYYLELQKSNNDTGLLARARVTFELSDSNNNDFFDKDDLKVTFDKADLDGDGSLSLLEFVEYDRPFSGNAHTPQTGRTTPSLNNEILEMFRMTDKNGDGIITLDEEWANSLVFDIDGDRRMSFQEYLIYVNGSEGFALAQFQFNQSDFNGDGYFDIADLQETLKQADLNGDGHITLSEYVQYDRPFAPHLTQSGPTGPTPALDTVFDTIFRELDADGNGKINPDELWASVVMADYNGDGRVSFDEYIRNVTVDATALNLAEAAFVVSDKDKNEYIELADVRLLLVEIDTDGDGEISELEYINHAKQFYANLGYEIEGFTPAPGSLVQLDTAIVNSFKETDADGNGTISFDEQWAAIKRYDIDGNNRVNLEEYLLNSTGESITFDEALFQEFDYDYNGYFDESDIRLGFDTMDTNGDGQLSQDEYVGFIKQFLTNLGVIVKGFTLAPSSNMDASLAVAFRNVDTDGNGIATYDELLNQTISYDQDGDNRLSLSEYLALFNGSESIAFGRLVFKEFDFNQDGYITDSDVREAIRFFDYDGNGDVTQDEYVGYLKRLFTRLDAAFSTVPTGTNVVTTLPPTTTT